MAGLILYDADCGFCTRVAGRVGQVGLRCDVAAIQDSDLVALGVSPDRAAREMPYVDAAGRVSYGHRAFAAAFGTGPFPLRALGRVMVTWPVSPVAAWAYRRLAANRHRLPGGTEACKLP